MSKKCFSSCKNKLPCSPPLCKLASGKKLSYCRLNGIKYKLNKDCEIISKDSGDIVEKKKMKKKAKTISKSNSANQLTHRSHSYTRKSTSYRPTINKDLVSLTSLNRDEEITLCNLKNYQLNIHSKTLLINIDGQCISVYDEKAKKYLLKQLKASKHLNMKKVYAPEQDESNCWFNSMFVILFISDKGRQFFHYFRSLMILGSLPNGDTIPLHLRNGFALLNYYIETCLSGLYQGKVNMNTNEIIKYIYKEIGHVSNDIFNYKDSGNPLSYYEALVEYMSLKSINIYSVECNKMLTIPNNINQLFHFGNKPPHIIVIEFGNDNNYKHKKLNLDFEGYKYKLDSCCIRNVGKTHFTALLTCNGEEYGFEGASKTRLAPMKWKHYLNSSESFDFGDSMKYNFLKSYHMLFYYRIK